VQFTSKVKQFLDRPWRFQKVEVPKISRQSAHEGCKVVSPTRGSPLASRKYSWYSFLLEAESTPGHRAVGGDYINEKFQ